MKGVKFMESVETVSRFEVIKLLSMPEIMSLEKKALVATKHLATGRNSRYNEYNKMGLLSHIFLDGFLVDKGHEDGRELYCINEFGIIYIFNENTKKLITIKGARGGQIYRYYASLSIPIRKEVSILIKKAYNREEHNPIHNI